MMKSKGKHQYVKWPSRENFLAFKKAKDRCISINKKAKKVYFKDATKYVMANKEYGKNENLFSQMKDVFLKIK